MAFLRKRWVWVVIVLCVVGGMWWWRAAQQRDAAARAEQHVVTTGRVVETVSVSGTVEPITSVDLSFEAIGTVAWVGVRIGDRVTKGQPLIRLDQASLADEYAAATQEVRIAEEKEKLQRRTWRDVKPEVRSQAKALAEQARARRSAIAVQMRKTTLVSPIDGIVTLQEAQEGERVKEVGTVIRIIADQAFEIEALVPESDIAALAVGKSGTAVFDALGREQGIAVAIDRINPEATTIQDVVYYKVYFRATQFDVSVKSGMSADVDLVMAQKENVVIVPRRLIGQDADGAFVTVVTNQDALTTERRHVTLGVQGDDGMVEVVDGIAPGAVLTTNPVSTAV